MTTRIGQGIDVHRFGEGDAIILGGVKIPFDYGFVAHSDGDVLLHAICDALLGALALGDIGKHFPDTDTRYEGINSRELLREVANKVQAHRFTPVNIDTTIVAERPKMAPYIDQMRRNIADDLRLDISCVGVKATTSETLGFTGRGEGIACFATCLLQQ